MIRLNVNVRRHKAGAKIEEAELGSVFVDQLVAAGQAERLAEPLVPSSDTGLVLRREIARLLQGLQAQAVALSIRLNLVGDAELEAFFQEEVLFASPDDESRAIVEAIDAALADHRLALDAVPSEGVPHPNPPPTGEPSTDKTSASSPAAPAPEEPSTGETSGSSPAAPSRPIPTTPKPNGSAPRPRRAAKPKA